MKLRVALFVALLGVGCTKSDSENVPLLGKPTGATCPPSSTLTYENFGKPFMDQYCVKCHAKNAPDRMGAPLYHDVDTLEHIEEIAPHIELTSAGGPNAINKSMPEDDPKPSDAERMMLGEWLACGTPPGTSQ